MAPSKRVATLPGTNSDYFMYEFLKANGVPIENVKVTNMDPPEMVTARRHRVASETTEDVLQSLAEAGEITRASLPTAGWTWHVQGLGLPSGTAQRLLGEVRAERGSP